MKGKEYFDITHGLFDNLLNYLQVCVNWMTVDWKALLKGKSDTDWCNSFPTIWYDLYLVFLKANSNSWLHCSMYESKKTKPKLKQYKDKHL